MSEFGGLVHELTSSIALANANTDAASKIYSALEENEIRTIRLHGWRYSADDPIVCSLITQRNASTGSYEALSYAWGTKIHEKPITLNGLPYAVTEALYTALKSLRRYADRHIWVDALAINQVDIPERNSAVQQMRQIYASAQETIIWLGPSFQKERNLFKAIEGFRDENRAPGCEACLSKPFHHFDKLAELWKSKQLELRVELREFCDFEYWERVWVVQEILYSQKATLYCGLDKLSMDVFRPFWLVLDKVTKDPTNPSFAAYQSYYLSPIPNQAIQVGFKPEDKTFSYDVWAERFCTVRKCTNPKDLVFGLYHCFPPKIQVQIRVDYSRPDHQVFENITQAYMESRKELFCFKHVERFSRLYGSVAYPSWTPTYSSEPVFVPYADSLCKSYPTEFCFERNGSCLCVRGARIGMIQVRYGSLSPEMLNVIELSYKLPGLERKNPVLGELIKVFRRCWGELGIPWDWAIEFVLAKTTYRFNDDRLASLVIDQIRGCISQLSTITGEENEEEFKKQLDNQSRKVLTDILSSYLEYFFGNSEYTAATIYKSSRIGNELGFPHRTENAFNLAIGNPNFEAGDEICVICGYECPVVLRRNGDSYIFLGNAAVCGMENKDIWDRFHEIDDCKLETFRIV